MSRRVSLVVAGCSIGFAAGCGGTGPHGENIVGTIGGQEFVVADSAAYVRTSRHLANVEVTDFADSCAATAGNVYPRTSRVLRFLLSDADANTPPTQPGTYTVHPLGDPVTGLYAACGVEVYDASCGLSTLACTGGTVTLTLVDTSGTGQLAGTFDITIGADHVTGNFDSAICANVSEAAETCL